MFPLARRERVHRLGEDAASRSSDSSPRGANTESASGQSRSKRSLQAAAAHRRHRGEAPNPGVEVHQVVGLLAPHLGDQLGQRPDELLGKRAEPDVIGRVVEVAPRDR